MKQLVNFSLCNRQVAKARQEMMDKYSRHEKRNAKGVYSSYAGSVTRKLGWKDAESKKISQTVYGIDNERKFLKSITKQVALLRKRHLQKLRENKNQNSEDDLLGLKKSPLFPEKGNS